MISIQNLSFAYKRKPVFNGLNLEFKPGHAELEKTTPHHCVMEEGILEEALRTLGVTAKIEQKACFRKGAEACRFVITSAITDIAWDRMTWKA